MVADNDPADGRRTGSAIVRRSHRAIPGRDRRRGIGCRNERPDDSIDGESRQYKRHSSSSGIADTDPLPTQGIKELPIALRAVGKRQGTVLYPRVRQCDDCNDSPTDKD